MNEGRALRRVRTPAWMAAGVVVFALAGAAAFAAAQSGVPAVFAAILGGAAAVLTWLVAPQAVIVVLLLLRSSVDGVMELFTLSFTAGLPLSMNLAGAVNSLAVGLGLLAVARRLVRARFRPERLPAAAPGWTYALFLAASAAAIPGSLDPSLGIKEWARLASGLAIFLLVSEVVHDERRAWRFTLVILASSIVPLAVAWVQALTGGGYFFLGFVGTEFAFRPQGTLAHPGILGSYLVVLLTLALTWYFGQERQKGRLPAWERRGMGIDDGQPQGATDDGARAILGGSEYEANRGAEGENGDRRNGPGGRQRARLVRWQLVALAGWCAAALGCLVLTMARTEWLGFVVAMLVVGLARKRRLALAVMAGAALLLAAVPVLRERLTATDSVTWRLDLWQAALSLAWPPRALGLGLGTSPLHINMLLPKVDSPPHNDYLKVLVETGVIGLAAYAGWLWAMARHAWRAWRRAATAAIAWRALGLLAVIAAGAVMSLSDNYLGHTAVQWYVWALAALVPPGGSWEQGTIDRPLAALLE